MVESEVLCICSCIFSTYIFTINNRYNKMKIYIASSWKNVHAVEMLTALLRDKDHEVL